MPRQPKHIELTNWMQQYDCITVQLSNGVIHSFLFNILDRLDTTQKELIIAAEHGTFKTLAISTKITIIKQYDRTEISSHVL